VSFSIKHPDFKSLQFENLIPIEFNQVDIDRMMTTIIELSIRQGRTMVSKTHPDEYARYLDETLKSPMIDGLSRAERHRVIDGWLRSTVVRMGTKTIHRVGESMDFIRPLTVGVYRSGLPKLRARNRKADVLAYKSLLAEGINRNKDREAKGVSKSIAGLVKETLGHGINTGVSVIDIPTLDESVEIDISALLTMRFLGTFEEQRSLGPANAPSPDVDQLLGPVPSAIAPLGQDIFSLLTCYGETLSPPELTEHMTALVSLRLFQYPLRVALACSSLLKDGDVPTAMQASRVDNPLGLFCDFTRSATSDSFALSRTSVQKDLEILRRFFGDRLLLRSIDAGLSTQNFKREYPEVEAMNFVERLSFGVKNINSRAMTWILNDQVDVIKKALESDETGGDGVTLIEQLRNAGLPHDQIIRMVLVEGLRRRGLEMQVLWFWSTGGITKNYGILEGSLKSRTSWRYSISDQLLTSLLLICFVEEDGTSTVEELEMKELLSRLKRRFGIYIAEPVESQTSAVTNNACSENRDSFVAKLQLLGCFETLSDDSSAQMVRRPRKALR
jgi:hypothetical protein